MNTESSPAQGLSKRRVLLLLLFILSLTALLAFPIQRAFAADDASASTPTVSNDSTAASVAPTSTVPDDKPSATIPDTVSTTDTTDTTIPSTTDTTGTTTTIDTTVTTPVDDPAAADTTDSTTTADSTAAVTDPNAGASSQTTIISTDENDLTTEDSEPSITYRAHVQDKGWMSTVSGGQTAGTTGKAKRLEALVIYLDNDDIDGSLVYNAHVQDIGWQHSTDKSAESTWTTAGTYAGTTGQSKRAEAIQIALTGDLAQAYDIYYRAHVSDIGWMDWRYDGEVAGTTGLALRLEAIQIQLLAKGETPASLADDTAHVYGFGHVQNVGWQPITSDGGVIGTTG